MAKDMTPERWREIERIYEQVKERKPEEGE